MTYDEIGSGGIIAGVPAEEGSGIVTVILTGTSSGGVVAGGQSNNTFSEIADGGVVTGGTKLPFVTCVKTASGGAVVGGTSLPSVIFAKTASGGAVTGGSSRIKVTRDVLGSGGAISGGHTIIIDHPHIGGGVIGGGSGFVMQTSSISSSGGSKTGGLGRPTFVDYVEGTGGSRTAGHGKVEKIKFRLPFIRSGVGRSIIGSSTAIVETEESKLFKPKYFLEQTSLKTNPREQLTGVWCEVEEACEEGVLPKVIQKRQKGFIPNPKGTVSPRDRGIATATGI